MSPLPLILRYSYVIWQERVIPFLVVELLSEGTEAEDLGQTVRDIKQPPTNWQVYEQILQIPYSIVFSRSSDELRVLQWQTGRYHRLTLEGQAWLPEIQLGIGLWFGAYQGLERHWLRWYDAQHHWIPTSLEQLEQERQRVEQEHQRAEQERQRAERLAAQLKALGIEPQ